MSRAKAPTRSRAISRRTSRAPPRSAGVEVKTSELVARGSTLPVVGSSPAVDAAVFALPAGGVTGPIVTDSGTVIVQGSRTNMT